MAGILVSPSLDSQVKKRSSLYKKRNESPKFRDVLRARCHARIKANRCSLVDKYRNLRDNEELHSTLSGILREEVDDLISKKSTSPRIFEDIEEPQDSEEDEWLIEEYEKILAEEEANFCFDWEGQVICPLCEMSVLEFSNWTPACLKCNVRLPSVESLPTLKCKLDSVLSSHSESCGSPPNFAVLDNRELSGLFLICETCLTFSQVI